MSQIKSPSDEVLFIWYTFYMSEPIQYLSHPYEVVPYSTSWPAWFDNEAVILKEIFKDRALDIQHVGSTSIPGMSAKPQLDILLQVQAITEAEDCTEALEKRGYVAYGDMLHKGGRLFSRWKGNEKLINLHVFEASSPIVWEYLSVRDYLRTHEQEAKDYEALKIDLYTKYPTDYLKYREFKDPYIEELKSRIKDTSS